MATQCKKTYASLPVSLSTALSFSSLINASLRAFVHLYLFGDNAAVSLENAKSQQFI